MQKILVIEDNGTIRNALRILLEMQNYYVEEAIDGIDGLNKFDDAYSLVIVDIMMPQLSGIEVCKKIREMSNVPVLFLTAKSSENDIALGLDVGGDDYLVKPFSNTELLARIKAMIRRHILYNKKDNIINDDRIEESGVVLYINQNHVEVDGSDIKLTDKEYGILKFLIENPGKVFSNKEIYEAVWKEMFMHNSENTIMVHIKNLRNKLSKVGKTGLISTVWGRGYKFER